MTKGSTQQRYTHARASTAAVAKSCSASKVDLALRFSSPFSGDGPLTTGAGEPPGLHPRSLVHYILYVPIARKPPVGG